jgi:DNA-binding MarR family transcriptional regulator
MDQEREPSVPVDNIRSLLHYVTTGIDARMEGYRRGTRYESVRPSDVRVFVLAQREPRTMADIAKVLGISRQAVQMSIKRLVALNVLELELAPGNHRDKLVMVTERGQAARLAASQQIDRLETECVKVIGADGLATLRHLLQALEGVFAAEASGRNKLGVKRPV